MTSESGLGGPHRRSWLERVSQTLLGELQDRDQIVDLLADAEESGLLPADVVDMIEGAMQVSEMHTSQVMVPWAQAVIIRPDDSREETLSVVTQSAHSRFPVIGRDPDEVLGIVHAKDLLAAVLRAPGQPLSLEELLRPAMFVPENMRLNALLREFRTSRSHMAVVVDEYGGVAGLVTLEDVLEQIVGEIDDEHDRQVKAPLIQREGASEFTVRAMTPIEDFNRYFQTRLEGHGVATIGGVVLEGFGRVPDPGEALTLQGLRFEVLNSDGRRVQLLGVTTPTPLVPPARD